MNRLLLTISLLISLNIYSQISPILVTETSVVVKPGETKEIFYSFLNGDNIIINFEMKKGKYLREFEIIELPNNSKFTEYKAKKILNKKITVRNKALYKFRFYNSGISKKVCKFKIERIPESEDTKSFNTNWKWKTIKDTIYTPYIKDSITGYRTEKYKETKKELINNRTVEEIVFNKNQRVHSNLSGYNNLTYLRVNMPRSVKSDLLEEDVIAWAYWIGVGKEAQEAYQKNTNSIKNLTTDLTTTFASPLAGLAVGTLSDLILPSTGEDVGYSFIIDYDNAQKYVNRQTYFEFDSGKGIAAYGKHTDRTTGTFYIGLFNDNEIVAIDVEVKIVAIKRIKEYEYKIYNREKEVPIIVKLNKERMDVKVTKVRIPVE